MTYSIIRPPFELNFREMLKKDLLAYREWFHAVMPERMAELAKAVKDTAGFETWNLDFTPDSLAPLGEWFRHQVETRQRTDGETGEIKSRLTYPIDVPNEELTDKAFSLAMDIGMYFGEVVIRHLPGTQWDQPVRNPNFADYGQPVIMGFGTVPLNPIRIAITLAYALAAREQSGARLRALFDIWSKMRR